MSLMRIVIVGGGIGGLAAALALGREGFRPEVYEQAPELLEVGAGIAVWPNAFRVLGRLGLGEAVLARAGRIEEARWLGSDGRLYRKFTLPDSGAPAVALRRADLQAALRGALPAGTLRLGKTLAGFEEVGGEVRARFADGGEV
ncbi:MAG TPA: NAD(P)-binding protein, partial [Pyrinomonadaceae bacterium]